MLLEQFRIKVFPEKQSSIRLLKLYLHSFYLMLPPYTPSLDMPLPYWRRPADNIIFFASFSLEYNGGTPFTLTQAP